MLIMFMLGVGFPICMWSFGEHSGHYHAAFINPHFAHMFAMVQNADLFPFVFPKLCMAGPGGGKAITSVPDLISLTHLPCYKSGQTESPLLRGKKEEGLRGVTSGGSTGKNVLCFRPAPMPRHIGIALGAALTGVSRR